MDQSGEYRDDTLETRFAAMIGFDVDSVTSLKHTVKRLRGNATTPVEAPWASSVDAMILAFFPARAQRCLSANEVEYTDGVSDTKLFHATS